MNLKKSCKKLVVVVACACSVLTLSGCGSSAKSAMAATYMTSSASYLNSIAWYANEDTMLVTHGDSTYELYYKKDLFGTTDPGVKGEKTIIYTGKYTSTPSADGDTSHLDLSLEAPTRIYMEQHGKAFGRDAISGNCMLDTANWTDAMTTIAFPGGSQNGAQDFLSTYGKAMTITVEDPSLSPDDTTLSYRIVTMPDESLEITGN